MREKGGAWDGPGRSNVHSSAYHPTPNHKNQQIRQGIQQDSFFLGSTKGVAHHPLPRTTVKKKKALKLPETTPPVVLTRGAVYMHPQKTQAVALPQRLGHV